MLSNPVLQHFAYVIKHKWFLLRAARRWRVPLWQVLIHDLSKFSRVEIRGYSSRYYTHENGYLDTPEWKTAWMHHWQTNPHHPEYWGEFRDMPERYVREMLADWSSAARCKGGPGPRDFYLQKGHELPFSPDTRKLVEKLLGIGVVWP